LKLCGEERHHIGSFDSETGEATLWNPTINGEVCVLQSSGDTLFAAGVFDTVNGRKMMNIAALDMTSGDLLDWNPGVNNRIFALAVHGSVVYAGGYFDTIGGQPRKKIAAIDRKTGKLLDWNPGANGIVRTIAVHGSIVYLGGDFDTIAGKQRKFIAAVDIATGNVTGWNPDPDHAVNSIVASGSTLYVGGAFSRIGGQNRARLAALDSANGQVTNWYPYNIDGNVSSMVLSGTKLNVCGTIRNINKCFGFSNYAILDITDTLVPTGQKNRRKVISSESAIINVAKYGNILDIRFNNKVQSPVILELHDIQGKRLATFNDKILLPGTHDIPIDISQFAKGCYYVVLKARCFKAVHRIVLW
jgi:hypothetical protein